MAHSIVHIQGETWSLLGGLALGIFGLIQIFNRWRDSQDHESDKKTDRKDKLEDDLIKRFEQRIAQLEKDRTFDRDKIVGLEAAVLELNNQNKLLRELNSDRNKESVDFRTAVLQSIKQAEDSHADIMASIEKLYIVIEKHLSTQKSQKMDITIDNSKGEVKK